MPDFLRLLFDFAELRDLFGVDAVIYAILALIGTGLFALRLGLGLLFGIGDELDFDTGLDADSDFGLWSVLSITAFTMGTGWMGLIAQVDWGLSSGTAAFLAVAFGVAMMLFAASMLFAMQRLAYEPKTDLNDAVGRTGTVYMSIPDRGAGKVRVDVQGQTRILDARSEGGALEAFSDIKVLRVRDDGVLVVGPLRAGSPDAAADDTGANQG